MQSVMYEHTVPVEGPAHTEDDEPPIAELVELIGNFRVVEAGREIGVRHDHRAFRTDETSDGRYCCSELHLQHRLHASTLEGNASLPTKRLELADHLRVQIDEARLQLLSQKAPNRRGILGGPLPEGS